METDFELKSMTKMHKGEKNSYVLNFSDGQTEKEITLSGLGKIKEVVKV